MTKVFIKYARLISIIQLLSPLMLGGCSIWYSAWYSDAQTNLHQQLKLNNPEAERPSFWDVSSTNMGKSSPVFYTGIALILGLCGGAGGILSAARLGELEKKESEFKREQESHADTRQYYYQALHDILVNFFCKQVVDFDNTCRASVYRHDEKAHLFRMVFRYSEITRFAEKGRVSLPEREGVVGATFLNGNSVYVSDLPTIKSKSYSKDVNKKLEKYNTSIQDATLSRLTMPSRCYFGYAIRDVNSNKKFAILIIESTNENQFNPDTITGLLKDQHTQIAKYVLHIAHIDSKLNPYGGA